MRELYLYWHVAPADLAAAAAGMRAFQAGLMAAQPGLQCRLLRRSDDRDPRATLMETYQRPGGIDAGLQAQIVALGAQAVAPWCDGQRHVELFEPLEP